MLGDTNLSILPLRRYEETRHKTSYILHLMIMGGFDSLYVAFIQHYTLKFYKLSTAELLHKSKVLSAAQNLIATQSDF